jgi:hypothetical protein
MSNYGAVCSRLRQPTPIAKSQALQMTLEVIENQSSIPVTTYKQDNTVKGTQQWTLVKSNSNSGLNSR